MDTGTGLALLGSAQIVGKLLGPTANYIGEGIKSWAELRVNNVQRIFENGVLKLGDRLDTKGAIPPRVLKEVLDTGSFVEDQVAVEYFGGVLASSRTVEGRDDRGVAWIELIGALSTHALRTHYALYMAARSAHPLEEIPTSSADLHDLGTYLPENELLAVMGVDSDQDDQSAIVSHVHSVLNRLDLVANFRWTDDGDIGDYFKLPKLSGEVRSVAFAPTSAGAELFLWAHGEGQKRWPATFLSPKLDLAPFAGIPEITGAKKLDDFKADQSDDI